MQPEDLVRQSMPFSYLYVTAESSDGDAHIVRLYSDITGGKTFICCIRVRPWLAFLEHLQDGSEVLITWANQDDGTNIILSERLVEEMAFTEIDNRAADAVEYYCHKRASFMFILDFCTAHLLGNIQINGTTTSWQISTSNVTRSAVINMSASLNNTADSGQAPMTEYVNVVQLYHGLIWC